MLIVQIAANNKMADSKLSMHGHNVIYMVWESRKSWGTKIPEGFSGICIFAMLYDQWSLNYFFAPDFLKLISGQEHCHMGRLATRF